MNLRAVLFDIDDTLYPSSLYAAEARRRAVEAMVRAGLGVGVDEAYAELMEVVREFTSNYSFHFDKLVQRLQERLRPGVQAPIVVAAGVVAYHGTKEELTPFPDALRALEYLRRTRILRGVLTNGFTAKQAEKLVRLGLHEMFSPNAIFISESMGIAKPHPKIFQIACESMRVLPGETLYVGDHPVKDVDPAHDAGLLACLRRDAGHHSHEQGVHPPDIVVSDLDELVEVLRGRYGVA